MKKEKEDFKKSEREREREKYYARF